MIDKMSLLLLSAIISVRPHLEVDKQHRVLDNTAATLK